MNQELMTGKMNDMTRLNSQEENHQRPIAEKCILCNKRIEDTGGYRITAIKFIGITLSTKYQGGGNRYFPRQSRKYDDDFRLYVVVWGKKGKWTKSIIEKSKR